MVYESLLIHENEVVILSCIQKGPTAHGLVPQFIVLRYTNLKEMYRLKMSDRESEIRSKHSLRSLAQTVSSPVALLMQNLRK